MSPVIVAVAIGAGILALGLRELKKVRASQSWVPAIGTVVETSVASELTRGSEDSPDFWSYRPVVKYRFLVSSQYYVGDQIRFDRKAYQNPKQAHAELAKYPVGSQVQLFFNPTNPADAVLERASRVGWVLVTLGTSVVLLALLAPR